MKDFIPKVVYRARHYSIVGRKLTWYEACSVVSHTAQTITIESQNLSCSAISPGGQFQLNLAKLILTGKCYSSRFGENFFLEKPEQEPLLPFPTDISKDAIALGWDLKNLTSAQFNDYITAVRTGCPLKKPTRRSKT